MKNLLFVLLFILSNIAFAQDTEVDKTQESNKEIPFAVIEDVPIYKGCDKNLSNRELKDCMSEKIIKHVSKNFNIKVSRQTDLTGNVRINVVFKVDKKGNIIGIRSRAPHPVLEQEAIRVIKLIPKMDRPGMHKGKPVIVPYSLPIVFNIVDEPKKPLTKKEIRRLKRKMKNN